MYYHEYYVIFKALLLFLKIWKVEHHVHFIGVNLRYEDMRFARTLNPAETLYVVSADFSHFLPMGIAIPAENCAAKCVLHRDFSNSCAKVIDTKEIFEMLNTVIPQNWEYQWVGRSRSSGHKGVGYLSFLLREKFIPQTASIDACFVTVYSKDMIARECLGQWYDKQKSWNLQDEQLFIEDVIRKGNSESRLTRGRNTRPVKFWTVTYLMRQEVPFIRGWHGILSEAFYLPTVMLENVFENGKWIDLDVDSLWPQEDDFNISSTLDKLKKKAGVRTRHADSYTVYKTAIKTGSVVTTPLNFRNLLIPYARKSIRLDKNWESTESG